jgi:hypothetical protein
MVATSIATKTQYILFLSVHRVQQQFPNSMGVHSQSRRESFPGMRCTVRSQMLSGRKRKRLHLEQELAQKRSEGSNEAIITEGKGRRKHSETRLKRLQFSLVSE